MTPRRSSTATVGTVPCNPLKSLASTVASTVPRRFGRPAQPIEVIASTVLDGPLSRTPHTPYSPKGSARALLTGLEATERSAPCCRQRRPKHKPATELNSAKAIPVGWPIYPAHP